MLLLASARSSGEEPTDESRLLNKSKGRNATETYQQSRDRQHVTRSIMARAMKKQRTARKQKHLQSRNQVPRGSTQLIGIKQGAGRTVSRAFGSLSGSSPPASLAFNAFHPAHLSLPRAVGQYSVVRVTTIITSPRQIMVLGPHFRTGHNAWANVAAIAGIGMGSAINAVNNTSAFTFSTLADSAWDRSTVVPSAFSVQLMNQNALQTTSGMIYAGRMRTMPQLGSATITWQDFADGFVAYNSPRLLSAGKLALRGIQTDLVPFNMNLLSSFSERFEVPSGLFTYDGLGWENAGFAPFVVYNPSTVDLTYLVTMEMRVRFDATNPAQATHTHHHVASDSHWDRCIHSMESFGNGVRDIVETVAAVGNVVEAGASLAGGVAALL